MADLQKIEQRKRVRQERSAKGIRRIIPKNLSCFSKKRHFRESLQDFRDRRKASNQRRRARSRRKFEISED